MRKIFLLFVYCLSKILYGQNQTPNTAVTQPVPTASSLTAYSNNPVSIQTGIPNISYPLFDISTNNHNISISLGLNYHAGNTLTNQWISNVGKGWSILGPGLISREIVGDCDESYNDKLPNFYKKNSFNDIYNFSVPGESGKFKIEKDTINNSFKIVKLTPFTSQIKINISANNLSKLLVDSYVITNDLGIKYEFAVYDISTMRVVAGVNPNTGNVYADINFRSAYYLTSIMDENNQELVKYNYLTNLTYVIGHPTTVESENHRLSNITIKDKGIININYSKREDLDKKNDKFSVDDIILKTVNNTFIKRYKFEYTYPVYRNLKSFSQVDANENVIEKYGFEYRDIPNPTSEIGFINANVLNKVHLPTGGMVEYNFDMPTLSTISTTIIPGLGDVYDDVSFTGPGGKKFFLAINEPKEITIDATDINVLAGRSWGMNIFRKEGNTFQLAHSMGILIGASDPDQEQDYNLVQVRSFQPGEYYIELSYAGLIHLKGPIVIHAYTLDGPPTEQTVIVERQYGFPRIRSTKYYDMSGSNVNNLTTPSRIEKYDYNFFDNPTKSSEYFVDGGSTGIDKMDAAAPSMIYKNVKVSNGDNIGYTKYYFKTPQDDDITVIDNDYFWPNYNITRNGLPLKQEIYNANNQKISEEIFEYNIQDFDGPYYYLPGDAFRVKTSWIKNESVISKNYFDSGITETKKEIFRNTHNSKPNLERSTSFDGRIQEISYQYAQEKNNQKLLQANITGVPLETISAVKKNSSDPGKVLSRSETKYDNIGNYYPSSSVSYDSQNMLASEVIFNRYDNMGNLEQFTTKDGIPTSFVWGYNKTQPIAKVEGATYDQIAPYVTDIIIKSNVSVISESNLQNALNVFRNNSNLRTFQITTYVYDALSRLKTSTPPSGVREVYQYDSAGRLEKVEDENGRLLKKYQYNYKH